MELERIFGPEGESAGLWAVRYEAGQMDVFRQVLSQWRDVEEMLAFCTENLDDLREAYGYDISAEEAAWELMEEADELEKFLLTKALIIEDGENLQSIFKPLENKDEKIIVLQRSKASAKHKKRREPKLRIYALRIAKDTYVVTGGAIKLTKTMDERTETRGQLLKLSKVRDWLKEAGVYYCEDLNELT